MPESSTVGLSVLSLLLAPAFLGAATVYSITDLGALPGGTTSAAAGISSNGRVTGYGDADGAFSQAFVWSAAVGLSAVDTSSLLALGMGVNASGMVVGYQFSDDLLTYQAFLYDGSGLTIIPTLGGASNAATAIDDSGTLVGYSETVGGAEMAFRFASGVVTPLGVLSDSAGSRANAINSSGVIVGQADESDGSRHAVVLSGASWIDLGVPLGYQSSSAAAVSNAGHVVGTLVDSSGGTMAFLWQPSGPMITLGALLPAGNSTAYGVNSDGMVVGVSDGVAFLDDGVVRDLNTMLAPTSTDWQLTEADAINDLGQIAGTGYFRGQQHAFLLDPEPSVPEPGGLLLVSSGLLLAALFHRLFGKEKYDLR